MPKLLAARLEEIRFLCLGAADLVTMIDKLTGAIDSHDFTAHKEEHARARIACLNDGGIIRKTVKVELADGEIFFGRYICYWPAGVVFWTAEGIKQIDPLKLPEDLQGCFPDDPAINFRKGVDKVISTFAAITEQTEVSAKEQACAREEISAGIDRLIEANSALQMENAELKARMRELE